MRLFNKNYSLILLGLICTSLTYTENSIADSMRKKENEPRSSFNKHTHRVDNETARLMRQRRNELQIQLNLTPPLFWNTEIERQGNKLTPEARLRNEANIKRGIPSWAGQIVHDFFYFMQFGNTRDLERLYQNMDPNISENLPQNFSNPLSTDNKLRVLKVIIENIGPNAIDIHSGETILHKLLNGHAFLRSFLEGRGGGLEADVLLRSSVEYLLSHPEIDLNIRDANGRASIHYAAIYKPEFIIDFVKAGADPIAKDTMGHSSLRYAVTFWGGHSEIIQSLRDTYRINPEDLKPLSISEINDPSLLNRAQARILIERELTIDEQRRARFINDLINDSEKYSESWRRSILQYALMENESFRMDLRRAHSSHVNGQNADEKTNTSQKHICNF